jgi:hypothetical protein
MPWWDNEHCEDFFQNLFGREEPKQGVNIWGEAHSSDESIALKGDCDTKFLGDVDMKDIKQIQERIGDPEGAGGIQEVVTTLFEHREELLDTYERMYGDHTPPPTSTTTTTASDTNHISPGWDPALFDLDDSDFYPSNKAKHHNPKAKALTAPKSGALAALTKRRG